MKTMLKIAMIGAALGSMLVADIPILPVQLVSDADAILGVRRRTRRRTAVVVGTTAHAAGVAQGTAAAQQPAPAAPATPAAAAPATPAPAAAGTALPMGTVVAMLPAGCVTTPAGGVEYYHCGGNFYRAVFQGNSLVYVTAQPK
jgi:hypothetical protein